MTLAGEVVVVGDPAAADPNGVGVARWADPALQVLGQVPSEFVEQSLQPIMHDLVRPAIYHRHWWHDYVAATERIVESVDRCTAPGATAWVLGPHLLLLPGLLRRSRPDLRIGYVHGAPFPGWGVFAQLPWRDSLIDGLLGADLIVTASQQDVRAVQRALALGTDAGTAAPASAAPGRARRVVVRAAPEPIEGRAWTRAAADLQVRSAAVRLREAIGAHQRTVFVGVDTSHYPGAFGLAAFGELLDQRRLDPERVVYVETSGTGADVAERINAAHPGTVYAVPLPASMTERAALFVTAQVLVCLPLRDGSAAAVPEFVMCRPDGTLLLSEFSATAAQFRDVPRVNPRHRDAVKDLLVAAADTSAQLRRDRNTRLRRRIRAVDGAHWWRGLRRAIGVVPAVRAGLAADLGTALGTFLARRPVLVAVDFDGTIAALVDDPVQARMLPAARSALERLVAADGVSVALLSGRRLKELRFVAAPPPGVLTIGSHGAEGIDGKVDLTEEQEGLLARLVEAVDDIVLEFSGTRTEVKPTGVVLHTRTAEPKVAEPATRAAVEGPGSWSGVRTLVGSGVVELAVVDLDKGTALHRLTDRLGTTATFFAGDDSTDEFAFRALRPGRDVTVKVGTTATAADYRVPRPTDLAAVLEQLADLATGPGRLPSEGVNVGVTRSGRMGR